MGGVINPKQMYLEYPLGVGILGTILQNENYNIKIYDGNAEEYELIRYLDQFDNFIPDIVGFSIITPNYPVAKVNIQQLKEKYKNIKLIAGGVHSTLFPNDLLNDGVDVVVKGEGEQVIVSLVKTLLTNNNLTEIKGIVYKYGKQIINNKATNKNVSLSDVPIVDRSLFNLKRYTHHSMIASRGCPYRCNFCCNYSGTILQKGTTVNKYTDIINEMKYLEDEFNAKDIFFADDIFLIKKSDILSFCSEYKKANLSVEWVGQMRADTIDEEIAKAISNAGCKRIYFGVESGSENILKNSNKRLTKKQLLNGITYAKNAGIRVKTGWIYGLPGTMKEQYESIDFMIKMRPHEISIHQLIPFPGTPYYENPELHGIEIKDKTNFESFCYGGNIR
ncbi:MAG: radical SAM protein [Campylobacterota bacterium]|nr:radical SAM protein [Campylobacterota bacterium]